MKYDGKPLFRFIDFTDFSEIKYFSIRFVPALSRCREDIARFESGHENDNVL
tara:strand:- start:239 stop:394 length:156 start_codon:yes stop_codon:yes gene_type:complete